mmetsp:Transcript_17667/g.26346  ORF Transcript_17667/g.26346 Transcript_17667/m.26346 type:complete len:211 (-) Transcript_17667:161-793(-)
MMNCHLIQHTNNNIVFDENRVPMKMNDITEHRIKSPSSDTIPMPKAHIRRTPSEVQLCEDMAAAEWREMCMFHRLVNGMQKRQYDITLSMHQQKQTRRTFSRAADWDSKQETEPRNNTVIVKPETHCVGNIMPTRNESIFDTCDNHKIQHQGTHYTDYRIGSYEDESFFFPHDQQSYIQNIDNRNLSACTAATIIPSYEEHLGEVFTIDL